MKGLKQAKKNDPRVSKVGAILRSLSIDEPLSYKCSFGEKSLVGPRPHAVEHNEFYRKLIPGYMQGILLNLITGLAS